MQRVYRCTPKIEIDQCIGGQPVAHPTGLQYSKNVGEWLDTQGEIVCFDPSVNQKAISCLLIRKDVLLKFLEENNLKIFWTCLGQKYITCDHPEPSKWLELLGVFTI